MQGKYSHPMYDFTNESMHASRQAMLSCWKKRGTIKEEKKIFQKKVFGEHYNYSRVGLNKQKKFLIEEQRNTEIERANRLLLEKIQRIAKRSQQDGVKKRAITQGTQFQSENISMIRSKQASFFDNNEQLMKSNGRFKTKMYGQQLKTPRIDDRRIFYRGNKEIGGISFAMTIYIEKGKYIISSEQGHMKHKIQMTLQNYRMLLNEHMGGDHKNIFQLLRFNGTLLELVGGRKQQISIIEQQEINLPSLKNEVSKYRNSHIDQDQF